MKKLLIIFGALISLAGCDFRHRIVSSGATPEEVQQFLNDSMAADSANASQIQAFNQDPNTVLYYAEWADNYAPMGPLDAVAPLEFDQLTGGDFINQITELRVFFFNKDMGDGSFQNMLVLSYVVGGGSRKTAVYSNTSGGDVGLVEDGKFSTILNGTAGQIEVISYDTSSGTLSNDGIQLQLFDTEDGYYYGKISNLEAF